MNLLLACFCIDRASADKLSNVLSCSGIRTNKRELIDLQSVAPADIAPFEIVILDNSFDDAGQAVDNSCEDQTPPLIDKVETACRWFIRHKAKRYLIHYPSDESGQSGESSPLSELGESQQSRQTSELNDNLGYLSKLLLDLIPDNSVQKALYCPSVINQSSLQDPSTISDTTSPLPSETKVPDVHFCQISAKTAKIIKVQLDTEVAVIEQSITAQGPLSILESMEALTVQGTQHIVAEAHDSNDFINVVRATEQIKLLVGSSALAMHLPALFRIRGWVDNEDQSQVDS
ncbi:MAG: hypothetical protein AB8B79_15015 [Granulosicoccus sp.]